MQWQRVTAQRVICGVQRVRLQYTDLIYYYENYTHKVFAYNSHNESLIGNTLGLNQIYINHTHFIWMLNCECMN